MKRLISLALLTLLLCGCTAAPQAETTAALPPQTTDGPVETTQPAGIYEPFSDLETQTQGAVRLYIPQVPQCYGLRMMGEDVLLFSGVETTTLTRLRGETLYPVAETELECLIYPEDSTFHISENGIAYHNPGSGELVFLDNDLKEVSRLELSTELTGKPVLSASRMKVYYCTADAVRVYDLGTGLDQMLKSMSYPFQSVEDILLEDSVLRCSLRDPQGQEKNLFLSTLTGELLRELPGSPEVTTAGETCYAVIPEGSVELLLFSQGEETRVLTPGDLLAIPFFLEESHGVLTASVTEQATVLDYYDLSTGLRTASVKMPGGLLPRYGENDPEDTAVYLMGYDYRSDCPVVLRWQLDQSPAEDDRVYTGPRYTLDNPDVQGLADCAAYAEELGKAHGLEILIGQAAVENQPWDYTLEEEYQVPVIRQQLSMLETYLSHFPAGFFESIQGEKKLCLVRSIRGNAESGSLDSATGLQFWAGDTAHVALAAGDTLEYAFYHEIFHLIDSKVLSDCRVYYYWHNLNPQGFSYYEDYTTYLTRDHSQYLQDENRAFIDDYSTTFPKEDRARIMEYACTAGNAHYFQSEIMQQKLRTLCEGIRTAFGLKDHPEPLLWEQYLQEPLNLK